MFAPGDIIAEKYQIKSLFGHGGMSNLYQGIDLKHGNRPCVVKEMAVNFNDQAGHELALHMFHREAKLLSELDHIRIPNLYDYFQIDGTYYVVMEYLPGNDLGTIIQQNPRGLPENTVIRWGIDIATTLYYLHRRNPTILFRDVKPSNIMITPEGVKLIDFGIARLVTPGKTEDTMRIGSPGYAPPEQYQGHSEIRSDIYSLGVTLHYALTGKDPTETKTPFLVPEACSVRSDVSQAFSDVLKKATALAPEDRYSSMLQFKKSLQALLPGAESSQPLTTVDNLQLSNIASTTQDTEQKTTKNPTGPLTPPPKQPLSTLAKVNLLIATLCFFVVGYWNYSQVFPERIQRAEYWGTHWNSPRQLNPIEEFYLTLGQSQFKASQAWYSQLKSEDFNHNSAKQDYYNQLTSITHGNTAEQTKLVTYTPNLDKPNWDKLQQYNALSQKYPWIKPAILIPDSIITLSEQSSRIPNITDSHLYSDWIRAEEHWVLIATTLKLPSLLIYPAKTSSQQENSYAWNPEKPAPGQGILSPSAWEELKKSPLQITASLSGLTFTPAQLPLVPYQVSRFWITATPATSLDLHTALQACPSQLQPHLLAQWIQSEHKIPQPQVMTYSNNRWHKPTQTKTTKDQSS